MEVVGGKRQRGRVLDHLRIELVPALHLAEADAVARHRQIFVAQEIAHCGIGRVEFGGLFGIGLGQPGLVRVGEVFGEVLHRLHVLRFLDRDRQQRVELLDHEADGELGLDHAAFHAFAELADRALGDLDIVVVAREVVFVIRQRLELRRGIAAREIGIEGVEAGEMVDRAHFGQRADFIGLPAQRRFLVIFEHIVGELVGVAQLAAIDQRQLGKIELRVEAVGIEGRIGQEIAQPVGIAIVAAEQPAQRIEFEAARIGFGEQSDQLVVLGRFGGGFGLGMVIAREGRIGGQRERKSGTRSECVADEFHGNSPATCITLLKHASPPARKRAVRRTRDTVRPAPCAEVPRAVPNSISR